LIPILCKMSGMAISLSFGSCARSKMRGVAIGLVPDVDRVGVTSVAGFRWTR
jgi:hypothetical protein